MVGVHQMQVDLLIVQVIGIPLPVGGLRYNEINNKIAVWSVNDGYGIWVVWMFSKR